MNTFLLKIKRFFRIDKSLFALEDQGCKLTLFGLAIPLFIEQIGSHCIALVQTMMSANYMDGFFVSPMNIVNSTVSPFIQIAQIISVGLGIILSINLGRKRYDDCKKIIGTAFIADMVICSIFYSLMGIFAEELIIFMGYGEPEYATKFPYAVEYMRVRSFALILSHTPIIFLAVLKCYGYTRVGIYTNVISNVVSAGLTAIMLYGIIPAKEDVLMGFIIIHVISNCVNLLLTIAYFIKKKIPMSFTFHWQWVVKIVKVGLPASIAVLAYTVSSTLTTKICVSLGENAYNARVFINQLVIFVYVFGLQLGLANKIMVGRLCGMGQLEKADVMLRQNAKIVATINGTVALAFASFGGLILRYGYSASEAIIAIAVPIFFIDIIVEIGRGLNHVGQNGLNATGDVNFTTVVSIVSGFACSVGLAYVFAIWFNLGLAGMWLAFIVDEFVRATLYLVRWCRGKWKKSFLHELEELDKEVA